MHPSQPSFHDKGVQPRPVERAWTYFAAGVLVFWTASFLVITYQRFGETGGEPSQLVRAFGLSAEAAVFRLELWRIVTYAALHDGVGHLIINVCCVLAPGMVVAKTAGGLRAILYAMAGVLTGGVATALAGVFGPGETALGGTAMSAGLISAYMVLRGDEPLFFLGRFGVPAWAAACVMLAASLYFASNQAGWLGALQVSGAAGGLAALYFEPSATRWMIRQHLKRMERRRIEEIQMRERLDRLLEKIHTHGLDGLTRSERLFLRKASERFQEREDARK